MKSETYTLSNTTDLGTITNALQRVLNSNVKDKGEKIGVLIQNEASTTEKRRLAQNNLWYLWIKDYAKAKSWTQKHARSHLKYYYALPIMRANPKHNLLISMFDAKADNVGSNRDLHFAHVLPMTSEFNVTEMCECLTETKTDIESNESILLSDKDDFYFKAMGLKR